MRLVRTPLREPRASAVRSYRVRAKKMATSSSTPRCKTRRAPKRPISASCCPSSMPPASSLSMASSSLALGATLGPNGVVLLLVVLKEGYAGSLLQQFQDVTRPQLVVDEVEVAFDGQPVLPEVDVHHTAQVHWHLVHALERQRIAGGREAVELP